MADMIHGLDGKLYPRPLAAADREFIIGRCHYLKHHDGLSVRQIKAQLEAEHNVTRSVGSISAYLRTSCIKCSGGQNVAPEQQAGGQH